VRAVAIGMALAASLAGCGWTTDEQVLTRFFESSRLYDRTMLDGRGETVFDPRTDGVVQRFDVIERSADERIATNTIRRRVTLRADVYSAGGRVAVKTLVATLEQRDGQWIVIAVR
jgi:hypothetical protein